MLLAHDPMEAAHLKLDAAFDFFRTLAMPFWCFHDRDVSPEGSTLKASNSNLDSVLERAARKMQDSGVKLLWGTANLFTAPRYMSGAATNPAYGDARKSARLAMSSTLPSFFNGTCAALRAPSGSPKGLQNHCRLPAMPRLGVRERPLGRPSTGPRDER
jgi:hypothetical protein